MWRSLVVLLIAGCMDQAAVMPDGGPTGGTINPPPSCPTLPALEGFDFYGEPCTAAPSPALTVCHDATDDISSYGWCISGVCRPNSGSPCPHCPAGTVHVSPDGASYCAPD